MSTLVREIQEGLTHNKEPSSHEKTVGWKGDFQADNGNRQRPHGGKCWSVEETEGRI